MKTSSEWPEGARHCLRVGSLSDKQVIEKSADHFDLLVVQGNLAASAPQGLATWPLDKPVWIDPITYAFAAAPAHLQSRKKDGTSGYRKTFRKLAEAFGAPYTTAIQESRRLTPADFTDGGAASVQRVLEWQETIFAPREEDLKYGAQPISPRSFDGPIFPARDLRPRRSETQLP